MDYLDLQKATKEFCDSCFKLDKAMLAKEEAFRVYRNLENEARKQYFSKLQMKEITNALYQENIRNHMFEAKVEFEALDMAVRRLQNMKDYRHEVLNTIKKSIN